MNYSELGNKSETICLTDKTDFPWISLKSMLKMYDLNLILIYYEQYACLMALNSLHRLWKKDHGKNERGE